MDYSIREAAEAAGVSKSTIQRRLKSGDLSKNSDMRIEQSELARLYPHVVGASGEHSHEHSQSVPVGQRDRAHGAPNEHTENNTLQAELDAANRMIEERGKTIEDLRGRLDKSEDERTAAQTKLTALLTDMRPTAPEKPDRGASGHRGRWLLLIAAVGALGAAAAVFYQVDVLSIIASETVADQ